ncbi:Shedu immune nuclease family protein [Salmonella bongori]
MLLKGKYLFFKKIDKIIDFPLYIGGDADENIPFSEFERLISNFPNSYELDKYVSARVESVMSSYVNLSGKHERQYHSYLNKKISFIGDDIVGEFAEYETFKYVSILQKLRYMLSKEEEYSEFQWQKEILDVFLLLYPKYSYVLREAPVEDFYNGKNRSVDFLLIDSSGNIDIAEIKKPFDKCIVTQRQYRDNYIPLKELSGTVMQIEKYIFHLNKSGKRGEQKLINKYKSKLPDGMNINITNPNGVIIMGRKSNLNLEQLQDFEIIKRKYKNLIDILTYDDLIERLEVIIKSWSKKAGEV